MLIRAIRFATEAHRGQVRKYTGSPYVEHPIEVGQILWDYGLPEHVVVAGILHDTLEDTAVTYGRLRDEFGKRVANLVLQVTDVAIHADGNRARRKAIDLRQYAAVEADAQSIKLADLISNTSTIAQHDPGFAEVYLAEKAALVKVLTRGHPALRERAGGD